MQGCLCSLWNGLCLLGSSLAPYEGIFYVCISHVRCHFKFWWFGWEVGKQASLLWMFLITSCWLGKSKNELLQPFPVKKTQNIARKRNNMRKKKSKCIHSSTKRQWACTHLTATFTWCKGRSKWASTVLFFFLFVIAKAKKLRWVIHDEGRGMVGKNTK